ncbi:MAG: cbb3-type cytochrome c oxidase subunit I, partial [Enterobacteriaceae bacterium]|nr:cbb3-type cytochrome c oxidase subunit I [Enterobacteriaceae bacterium]
MKIIYNYKVVKQFTITAILWGVIGMIVGLFIASELIWPDLNNSIPWLSYGRLRPLHTNAVIFAFGGSALIATSYYIVQRTCQTSLAYAKLASFTFWGWQLVIISAVITLPLGYTTTKEYAELEWPISLLITIIWICYGAVYFGTIMKRTVSHIYVSNWFYGSFIIAIGLLHVINNIAIPVTFWKSYSVYAGAVDAMVQWWYG